MKVQLNRAHFPVTVLGHGRRIGLWFQGCSVGCDGCIALDTWAPDPGAAISVEDVVDWCRGLSADSVDGVTISGGEPFDQPQALLELLSRLHDWRAGLGQEIDLLCYSGRALTFLRAKHQAILNLLDVVIPGAFVAARAPGAVWRGSANQPLVPLTKLGHRRYDAHIDRPVARTQLQVTLDGGTVWYIGVPQPGDFAALEAALARRGLSHEEASWRS
jgi:anaerobic ribonucleoside-triphosphate reductase activating protein